jgi:hypothetical protein
MKTVNNKGFRLVSIHEMKQNHIIKRSRNSCRAGNLSTGGRLEVQKAKRLFGWQAEEYVWKVYRETEWIDVDAMKLLICVDPAKVLSILRKTRPAAVRNWHDEDSGDRLYLAALAHEALQRPKQAALLFRLAAREIYSWEDKRECLKRAKKLET